MMAKPLTTKEAQKLQCLCMEVKKTWKIWSILEQFHHTTNLSSFEQISHNGHTAHSETSNKSQQCTQVAKKVKGTWPVSAILQPADQGSDCSPVHRTGEDTSWMPCLGPDLSLQERHWGAAAWPEKGKRGGAQVQRGTAEGGGGLYPGEKGVQGDLITLYNHMKGCCGQVGISLFFQATRRNSLKLH